MLSRTFAAAFSAALGLWASPPEQVAAPRAAPAPSAFFVTGRGWGHGIGMSQYGALGHAQRGAKFNAILAHYYPGTTLGPAPLARVRVLLAEGRRRVTVSSKLAFKVRDGRGKTYVLESGSYAFGPGLRVKVDGQKPAQALPGPLLFSPGATVVALDGRPYRGALQVASVGNGVQVINVVGLELYLAGVVSREMPRAWPSEALKAQAVVARSYALSHLKTGAFDMYADTRSQVYGGVDAESPSTTAAVNATAGRVLLYRGRVAKTYFFSTSGGRTAAIHDVWNSPPIPYLVAVPDPYDSISPHHQWGPIRFAPRVLARRFGISGRLLDVETIVNPSNRVRVVIAKGVDREVSLSGADVRRVLGLRSTWFRVGVLALGGPGTLVHGAHGRLSGVARGAPTVELQQRPFGGSWKALAALKPRKDGTVAPIVAPKVTTSYRLVVGEIASAPARVPVAPLVRLQAAVDRRALNGTVRPLMKGAFVQVQRQAPQGWTNVAGAEVDGQGAFTARLDVVAGVYRARVGPRRGLVAGTSPIVRVGPA